MRRFNGTALAAGLITCLGSWLSCFGDTTGEVPRVPPAYCEEALRPLLTPFEKISKEYSDAQGRGGVLLLSEEISLIAQDGKRLLAVHSVSKALNQAGAKELEEQTFHFRKKEQKVYLAQARTFQPDGTSLPVRPEAAFVKNPQPGADDSIYDDMGELVILFPNVKTGAITESILIYEEPHFRIPGEFTFYEGWLGGWPVAEMRDVVELPKGLAARLKFKRVGEGVPESTKEELGERVRWTWSKKSIPATSAETQRAPESQIGPSLWGSTLADWNAFTAWYGTLLKDRDKLSPGLTKSVEEWTKEAHSPREIADILAMKVSKEVRYLGLEFGQANLQPHDCNEVWDNQYGDCKDKANLLRAMLAQKGIRSHIALLNTEHSGKIQKETPDYRCFTHAIVAIEGILPRGGYCICDPTVPYAKADTLAPSDSDRDLLLVKGQNAEWVHSPKAPVSDFHYDFDLSLGAGGELSGWLSEESSGMIAGAYAFHYERLDTPSTRSSLQSMLRELYNGAELTDFQKPSLKDWNGTYRLKMHFAVPAPGSTRELTASFPNADTLCPNLGTVKERETPFFQTRKRTSVTLRIKVPAGFSPRELPKAFRTEGTACAATASWHFEPGVCVGELAIEQYPGTFSPGQFLEEINAMGSLESWLAQPLILSKKPTAAGASAQGGAAGGSSEAAQSAEEDALPDFPKLSSGNAQLALVDKLYPSSGDLQNRYLALKKTLEYFPSDKTTRFIATVTMANLDRQNHKAFEAANSLAAFLKTQRKSNLGIELLSWGDYILALALSDSERDSEAISIFKRVAETPGVPKDRKAWCRYFAAWLIQKESPQKACALLLPTIQETTTAQATSIGLAAQLLAKTSKTKELEPLLAKYFLQDNANLEETLGVLNNTISLLVQRHQSPQAIQVLAAIEAAAQSTPALERVQAALSESRKLLKASGNADIIQKNLREFLQANPSLDFLKLPLPENAKTKADFDREMQEAKATDLYLRCGCEMLTRFAPENGDSYTLFMMGVTIATQQETSNDSHLYAPLLREIFHIFDQFPEGDAYFHSGKILQAWVLRSRGNAQAGKAILEKILAEPDLPETTQRDVRRGLAHCEEALGRHEQALELYNRLEDHLEISANRLAMVRPVLLNLELGNEPEALRILKLMNTAVLPQPWKPSAQYTELVRMAATGKAQAFWSSSSLWWKSWEKLEALTNLEKPEQKALILEGGELNALNTALASDFARKDRPAFLKHFRSMIRLGRWQPSAALEAARLAHVYAPTLAPAGLAQNFHSLALEILDQFPADHPDARLADELRILHLVNSGKAEKGLELAHKFLVNDTLNDIFSQDIKRVRAHAAVQLGRDLEPAAASLEALLNSPKLSECRAATVWYLALVYKKLGRTGDERRLIEEEMKKVQVNKDPSFSGLLQSRLNELQRTAVAAQKPSPPDPFAWLGKLTLQPPTAPGKNPPLLPLPTPRPTPAPISEARPNSFPPIVFSDAGPTKASTDNPQLLSAAVTKWLSRNRPAWFDFAEPKALDQYSSVALDTLLNGKPSTESGPDAQGKLGAAEIAKLGLLVAQSPSLPPQIKQLGFEVAFRQLLASCKTWQESRDLTASVVESFEFPENTRITCLCTALQDAAIRGNVALTEHYRIDPLTKRFNEPQRNRLEALTLYAKTDRSLAEKIQETCSVLSEPPLTPGRAQALDLCFWALLRMGKLEQAKELNESIGKIPAGLQNASLPTSLQYTQIPGLKATTMLAPLHRSLIALVEKQFPEFLPKKEPEVFSTIHDPREPRFLNEEDLAKLLLFRVKTQQVFADQFSLWVDLSRSIRQKPRGKELVHELLSTSLRTAPNDTLRAIAIDGILQEVDMDDPSERNWVASTLLPYQNDSPQSETLARIRLSEVRSSLRSGKMIDLEKAFETTKTSLFQRAILGLKLRHYLNTWNLQALKAIVDVIRPGDMIHPSLLPYTVPALDALGMTSEAQIARSAAKREVYRAILDSWFTGNIQRARQAIALASALGDTPLPEPWFAALEKTQNKEDQLWVRIQAARARKEWQTVADLSAEGEKLPSNPTQYYWLQAEALNELGKPSEALKPLETFISRGMDWADYPAACRLRQKLQAKP